jgi:hypothetical protein
MTGRRRSGVDDLNAAQQGSDASASSSFGDTSGNRKRARQVTLTYGPCTRCRNKETYARLTHAIQSFGTLELAAMQQCDCVRPTCAQCRTDNAECVYDNAQASTYGADEKEDLRYQLDCRTREYRELVFLLRLFRFGSDQDATALLARIRIGDDVESIVQSLRGSIHVQQPSSQS